MNDVDDMNNVDGINIKTEVLGGDDAETPEEYIAGREGFGYLPPIIRIKIPKTQTQSALIRWLAGVGYQTKDIAKFLDKRYQQVRNILVTQPKRAAREDLPELVIELADMPDAVDMLLDMGLERTFAEERQGKKKRMRDAQRRADEAGNEDLDMEVEGD